MQVRELALFAGAGGGVLGSHLCGWRTVAAVEISDFCRRVLRARQCEGHLPEFPVYEDVRTFDGTPWRDHVDIITGGFPCQDISSAGNGAGLAGARSGLWREFARIIGEARPPFALIENSPLLSGRGLNVVLGDLASMGYDASWGVVGARDTGAPHRRDRMWVLAYSSKDRLQLLREQTRDCSGASRPRCAENGEHDRGRGRWWPLEPGVQRMAHGVADRMERLAAIGNGQVPAVVPLVLGHLIEQALTCG